MSQTSQQHRNRNTEQAQGRATGDMSVREAGQLGAHKGGQRERELVRSGHHAELRGGRKH